MPLVRPAPLVPASFEEWTNPRHGTTVKPAKVSYHVLTCHLVFVSHRRLTIGGDALPLVPTSMLATTKKAGRGRQACQAYGLYRFGIVNFLLGLSQFESEGGGKRSWSLEAQ